MQMLRHSRQPSQIKDAELPQSIYIQVAHATFTTFIAGQEATKTTKPWSALTTTCQLIQEDICTRPGGHCIFCGDVNASRGRIVALEDMINHVYLTDLGGCASSWGGTDHQVTCRASEIAKSSCRYYMLLTPGLMEHVNDFRVISMIRYPRMQR